MMKRNKKSAKLSRYRPVPTNNFMPQINHDPDQANDEIHDDVGTESDGDGENQDVNQPNRWRSYIQNKRQKFDDDYVEHKKYLQRLRERALEIQAKTGQKFYIEPPVNRYDDVPLGDPKWRICDPETLSPEIDHTAECYVYLNKFYFEPEDPKLTNLFDGVCIFVNGYTNPVASMLHTMMSFTGGRYTLMFDRYRTTHTISTVLSVAQRKSERSRKSTVTPEWIMESLRARKLLPLYDYLVFKPKNGLREMFARMHRRQQEEEQKILNERKESERRETEVVDDVQAKPGPCKPSMNNDKIVFDENEFKLMIPKSKAFKSFLPPSHLKDCDQNEVFSPPNPPKQTDLRPGSPELLDLLDWDANDVPSRKDNFENREFDHDQNDISFNESAIKHSTPKRADPKKKSVKDPTEQPVKEFNQLDYMPSSASKMDSEILENLPEDIRKEVMGYVREKKNDQNKSPIKKTTTTKPISGPPLPTMKELYKNRTVDTLFKSKTNSPKKSTNAGPGPSSKGPKRTSNRGKIEDKKQLRIDFMLKREMIRAADPKHRALSIYYNRIGNRKPNVCGKQRLKNIRPLLEEWICTFENLTDVDVVYILKYFMGLIEIKKFQDLKEALRIIKNAIQFKCDRNKPVFEQWKMMFIETFPNFLSLENEMPDDLLPENFFKIE